MRRGGSPRRGGGRPARPYSQAPKPQKPPPPHPPPPRKEPGVFKQMAATAGGVAVGSAVGHAVGAGITGMFSGRGGSNEVHAAREHYGATEPTGPCAWEIKQFLKCAENQEDISVCTGFNEAIKNCKQQHANVGSPIIDISSSGKFRFDKVKPFSSTSYKKGFLELFPHEALDKATFHVIHLYIAKHDESEDTYIVTSNR